MFLFWALILLGILVLIHELGHFLFAKMFNVKVPRFSIGFGPKLVGFRAGETEYRISAVPLGGYVKLLAQEPSEDIPPGIIAYDPNGPAAESGVKQGDRILKVCDTEVANWTEIPDILMECDEMDVPFELEREGGRLKTRIRRGEPAMAEEQAPDPFGRHRAASLPDLGLTVGDHPEELERAFYCKPLWQRFAVVAAGPISSLLFPIIIYFIYFLSIDTLTSPRIGLVMADMPAHEAGLQPGDRITSINGKETLYWGSMAAIIRENAGKRLSVKVERGGEILDLNLTPEESKLQNQIGDEVSIGRIGILSATFPGLVGPVGKNSPAYSAGLRLGDRVVEANGKPVEFIWQIDALMDETARFGRPLKLVVERRAGDSEEKAKRLDITITPVKTGEDGFMFGLASADSIVGKVHGGSPAEKAGFKVGDRVLSVEGRRVSAWMAIEQVLREKQDKPISFEIERDGEKLKLSVIQKKEIIKGELKQEITRFSFGAWSAVEPEAWLEGERVEVENRLSFAVISSAETLVDITIMELEIFGKLFRGQIPFKMLGGPIMIFDIAGKAAEKGFFSYIWMMALISINLGILNFLPVPVLDGGHLLFFSIEAIIRRPINQRLKERAIMAGFISLMVLMALVMMNDLERYL